MCRSKKNKLIIYNITEHTDHFQGTYSKRPLNQENKVEIKVLQDLKASNTHIARHISIKTNNNYTTKDIRNLMKSKIKRNEGQTEIINFIQEIDDDNCYHYFSDDNSEIRGILYQDYEMKQCWKYWAIIF